jgi:predicted transcriptional regulator
MPDITIYKSEIFDDFVYSSLYFCIKRVLIHIWKAIDRTNGDRHLMMLLNSMGLVQGNTGRKAERIYYDQSLCARQG